MFPTWFLEYKGNGLPAGEVRPQGHHHLVCHSWATDLLWVLDEAGNEQFQISALYFLCQGKIMQESCSNLFLMLSPLWVLYVKVVKTQCFQLIRPRLLTQEMKGKAMFGNRVKAIAKFN